MTSGFGFGPSPSRASTTFSPVSSGRARSPPGGHARWTSAASFPNGPVSSSSGPAASPPRRRPRNWTHGTCWPPPSTWTPPSACSPSGVDVDRLRERLGTGPALAADSAQAGPEELSPSAKRRCWTPTSSRGGWAPPTSAPSTSCRPSPTTRSRRRTRPVRGGRRPGGGHPRAERVGRAAAQAEQHPDAGRVRPGPDRAGPGWQARPGDRPGRGGRADHRGPLPAQQEQPRPHRRPRRR